MRKFFVKREAKPTDVRRPATPVSDRDLDAVAGGHGMIRAF